MRRATIAGLVLGLLVLGGCADDEPEPKFAPTESAAATPSPSETEAVERSPEETVRAWVQARNFAMRSGDVSHMRALSAPGCRTCVQHMAPIKDVHEAGGSFETRGWRIKALRLKSATDERAEVTLGVKISGGSTIRAAGEEPVVYPSDHTLMLFKLRRDPAGWLIAFIGYYS